MFKRIFDLSSSIVGLTVLSPLLVITIIAIKKGSPGPALFKQKRPGLDNKLFTMYKFRSMAVETPDVETAELDDSVSYVTRIGDFIRKTSLDELPQLINVTKGEMSIVGPRPALHNQYKLIDARTKVGVHRMKPGITGYAQVMGRDDISDEQKVAYDKYYVENQTFSFDLWIIWRTLWKIIYPKDISH